MGGKDLIHHFAGVIDGTYRGEWKVRLCNHSDVPYTITEGDRIVQGIFTEVINATWDVVNELPATVRGEGGFGSSGR
jgi:dUTP pyrophosphatase